MPTPGDLAGRDVVARSIMIETVKVAAVMVRGATRETETRSPG